LFFVIACTKNTVKVTLYDSDGNVTKVIEQQLTDSAFYYESQKTVAQTVSDYRRKLIEMQREVLILEQETAKERSKSVLAMLGSYSGERKLAAISYPKKDSPQQIIGDDTDKGGYDSINFNATRIESHANMTVFQPKPDMFTAYMMLSSLEKKRSGPRMFKYDMPGIVPAKPHPVWGFLGKTVSGVSELGKWVTGAVVVDNVLDNIGDRINDSYNSSVYKSADSTGNSNVDNNYSGAVFDSSVRDSHDDNSSVVTRTSDSHDDNSVNTTDSGNSTVTTDYDYNYRYDYDYRREDNSIRTFDYNYSRPVTIDWREITETKEIIHDY